MPFDSIETESQRYRSAYLVYLNAGYFHSLDAANSSIVENRSKATTWIPKDQQN